MQPARAQRIASQTIRASARASHPVHRSALHRNQLATHRPAHRILCSAAHRANATSPRAAHCIANNPRTDNQPATHRPPRPLCIARRTAHTSHMQFCTRFAVLCAGFVWFVVLTFPKFNLYTFELQFCHVFVVQLVLSSEIWPCAPGSIPGENFRIFSIFVIFFSHKKKKT
jgi:hypothetical protein